MPVAANSEDALRLVEMMAAQGQQAISFTTFDNYLRAWTANLTDELGGNPADPAVVREAMKARPTVTRMRPRSLSVPDFLSVRTHLERGGLTIQWLRTVKSTPNLAPVASLWLPVMAYYVAHAFGSAAWIALGNPDTRSHSRFRRHLGEIVANRFPSSLAGTCVSGPTARDHRLDNLGVTAPECAAQSNLGSFVPESAELLVGKSLTTTRQEFIDSRCDELRRGLLAGRTRLSSDQVDEAHRQFPTVGLLDFLWRLRTRSNYDDPDLHVYSANFPDQAVTFCDSVVTLSDVVAEAFRAIVELRLGPVEWKRLNALLPTRSTP